MTTRDSCDFRELIMQPVSSFVSVNLPNTLVLTTVRPKAVVVSYLSCLLCGSKPVSSTA